MRAAQAIRFGAHTVNRARRMIYVWWFALVVLGLMTAGPMAGLLASQLSHSEYAVELLKGFDLAWIAETYHASQGIPVSAVLSAFALTLAAGWLVQLFLAGGAIAVFTSDSRRFTVARFLEGCGRYFWRFLRLFLISLFFYWLAVSLSRLITKGAYKIWGQGMEETPMMWASRGRTIVLILMLGFVITVFDYAKIQMVAGPSRSAFRAAAFGLRFVLRNLWRTLSVWLILAVIGFLFYILYDRIAAAIPGQSVAGLVLILIAQQLYVMTRLWVRLTSWAAAAEIYLDSRKRDESPAEPVPAFVWPPETPPTLSAVAHAPLPPEDEAAGPA